MTNGRPDENVVHVPLDEWMQLVGEKIARKAADDAVTKHIESCPARGMFKGYIKPALAGAITAAFIMILEWLVGRHGK